MAKRMYEDAGLDLDEIVGSEVEVLLKHAGSLYNISGLVFQGNEKNFIVMSPNASELIATHDPEYPNIDSKWNKECWYVTVDNVFAPTIREFQAILKRTDDPLIFEKDETGTLKAIVRKSQRVISGAVQQMIWSRDNFQCMFCGQSIPDIQATVDHFYPLEKGGKNTPDNLLTVCRSCGKMKGNQDPIIYCKKHGYDYMGLKSYLEGKASSNFIGHLMNKNKKWQKKE